MSDIKWIYFISKRFSKIDRKGRTAATSRLASIGVCFGVMALIVVMAVMNGFQMSLIDSVMEISSYHVRVKNIHPEQEKSFSEFCHGDRNIVAMVPFRETQGLLVSKSGQQSAAIVRSVPENIFEMDKGFARELKIVSGRFDLSEPDSIVIGNTIAHDLKLRKGSLVSIAALGGSNDSSLLGQYRTFKVKGIFFCGFADINASYCFIGKSAGDDCFGDDVEKTYGIKLKAQRFDSNFIERLVEKIPEAESESWRHFNRSFFGVLRMEKNILFMIVFLIFVVVAINIYNSMKRLVYERKEEIAVLSALGGNTVKIRSVFLLQGSITGLSGAVPGLALGIIAGKNISAFFNFAAAVTGNTMFSAYARIPARLFPFEVLMIFLFGFFASVFASWLASSSIIKLNVSEVLRNE